MTAARAAQRAAIGACIALGIASINSCDPCFGAVPGCSADPHVAVTGRIVESQTGRGVGGVTITIRLAGAGADGTAQTTSNGVGFFQIDGVPIQGDSADAEISVQVPGRDGYTVHQRIAAQSRRGWAHDLGLWVDEPYYAYTAEFVRRCSGSAIRTDTVLFTQLAGPDLSGLANARSGVKMAADANSRVRLFGPRVGADTLLPLIGSLATIHGVRLASGVDLQPSYRYQAAERVLQLQLGPTGTYVGCLYNRFLATPAAGIQVDFVWTGGAATVRQAVGAVSDSTGLFAIDLGPLAEGPVVGDLTVHSPAPSNAYVVKSVALHQPGAADDSVAVRFGVGLHLPYFGVTHHGGAGVANSSVTIHRRSGAAVAPNDTTLTTDAFGNFTFFGIRPLEQGTVVFDVSVVAPGATTGYRIEGLSLSILDADASGSVVLQFDFDAPTGVPFSARVSRKPND